MSFYLKVTFLLSFYSFVDATLFGGLPEFSELVWCLPERVRSLPETERLGQEILKVFQENRAYILWGCYICAMGGRFKITSYFILQMRIRSEIESRLVESNLVNVVIPLIEAVLNPYLLGIKQLPQLFKDAQSFFDVELRKKRVFIEDLKFNLYLCSENVSEELISFVVDDFWGRMTVLRDRGGRVLLDPRKGLVLELISEHNNAIRE